MPRSLEHKLPEQIIIMKSNFSASDSNTACLYFFHCNSGLWFREITLKSNGGEILSAYFTLWGLIFAINLWFTCVLNRGGGVSVQITDQLQYVTPPKHIYTLKEKRNKNTKRKKNFKNIFEILFCTWCEINSPPGILYATFCIVSWNLYKSSVAEVWTYQGNPSDEGGSLS